MNAGPAKQLRAPECALWAIALLLIQVGTYSGFFFRHEILTPSDLLFEISPWREHRPASYERPVNVLMYDPIMAFRPDFLRVQETIRQGRWPLWNNMEMGGVPLLANCQSRVFYPLHLLLLFTDVDTAMSLFIVLKLWLAAFTAYVCARLLGFDVWPSRWYSIVWGFGCFTHLWAYWPITDVLVWVPVVFVGTEWLAVHRFRKGFFALALGGVMLLFAGHPETAFAVNAYMALYFIVRLAFAWRSGKTPWRPLTLYAGGWTLAIAVYAVQLLPFLEYLRHSAPVEERIRMPLTFGALVSFWVPRFLGTNAEGTFWDKNTYNSNLTIEQYVGMAAWLGVAFAIVYALRRSSCFRRDVRACVFSLLLATLVSLSMAMELYFLDWAQDLPGFSHMRTIYHAYFSLFAIPTLGLIGLDAWFARPRRIREMSAVAVTIVPAAAVVGFLWSYNARLITAAGLHDYVWRELITAAGFALVIAALICGHCVAKRTAALWTLLIVVSLADVYWPVRGLNPSLPREASFQTSPLIAFMQEQPKPCRFDLLGAAIAPGTIGNFNIEEWEGYDGLYPARPMRFRKELATKVWDRMVQGVGVDYYLNDPRYDELAPIQKLANRGELARVTTLDRIDLYHHETVLPRARLVGKLETAPSIEALFSRMLDTSFDPARVAITEAPPKGPLPNSDSPSLGSASINVHTPDHVAITCDAKSDAVLTLAENYYVGWHATVDGAPVPVFPVYYTFQGVVVPKGLHVVEFHYTPRSVMAGLALSALALVSSSAVALSIMRRSRAVYGPAQP